MSRDVLGDRMKLYESRETGRQLMPRLPICVRIDGRSFSKWTRSLRRPYDEGLSRVMVETTKFLVEEANAMIGYTQSDEISLILRGEDFASQPIFGAKIQKLTSVLASAATARFLALLPEHVPSKAGEIAMFDCRVWSVPDLSEAANVLLWREMDAIRNSIQSAAYALYSHNQLDKKSTADMQAMILAKGIDWESYPVFFKRGTYLRRGKIRRLLSEEERSRIPEAHRPPADSEVERTTTIELELPPLIDVANRAEVLFAGAEPILKGERERENAAPLADA
ncbi:MAG: tRNA(His) guanylyltransferase Thg1 family protein [Nannocystaceae bacterium]